MADNNNLGAPQPLSAADQRKAADADKAAASQRTENREKQLSEQQKQTEADNKAAMARTENVQPTPTQEENDKAKLGVESLSELDGKEADGSPDEEEAMRARNLAGASPAGYETRASTPAKR